MLKRVLIGTISEALLVKDTAEFRSYYEYQRVHLKRKTECIVVRALNQKCNAWVQALKKLLDLT